MTATSQLPTSIDIAICTYRRPALQETLSSLFALSVPTGVAVRLVVADNDASPSARDLVDEARRNSPFPIEYVHCPKSNISIARNACLQACKADYLAFIDDDELASSVWLQELYATILETGADAVLGPVEAVYDPSAPAWMRRGDFHSTLPVWVQGTIKTGYTCNVILDMRSPQIANRRFDLALGQTGGEDTQFFAAVIGEGGAIAFAPAARLTEAVTPGRATLSWLLKRRFRSGQTHGRIVATGKSAPRRLLQGALAFGKSLYCAAAMLALAAAPVPRNRFALRAILHAGAVTGLLGIREIRQYGLVEAS